MPLHDTSMDGRSAQLRLWLNQHSAGASLIAIRTGFLSRQGLAAMLPWLERMLHDGGSFHLVTGGAPDQPDPSALWQLLKLQRQHGDRVSVRVIGPTVGFHNAKTYYVQHSDGHAVACVGSVNLTGAGLDSNHEVWTDFDSAKPAERDDVKKALAGVLHYGDSGIGARLSARLIEEFESAQKYRPSDADGLRESSPAQPLGTLLREFMRDQGQLHEGLARRGMSSGLEDLDAVTSGLHEGTLVAIGARPGIGKTSLALQIATNAALRDGKRTSYFGIGMQSNDIAQRIYAAEARVDLSRLRRGQLTTEDRTRLQRTEVSSKRSSLLINCVVDPTIDWLDRELRRLSRDVDLSLVVIDPVYLVRTRHASTTSRKREALDVMRQLKALALELNIVVVVTTDLDRRAEARGDAGPILTDVRDTDAVADIADVVILIHRPDALDDESPRLGDADLIVAKNRYGPTSTVTVAYRARFSRFASYTRYASGSAPTKDDSEAQPELRTD